MSSTANQLLTVNGANYDISQLPPEGQKLLSLLTEAQSELTRLETRKELLLASQQQLLSGLKPLLPAPLPNPNETAATVLGKASDFIPTTSVTEPTEQPASFPETLPDEIRARQ